MKDSKTYVATEVHPAGQGRSDLKDKILEVAIKKFAHEGFNTVSMRELADDVGVTKPALYYHFKNKDELFEAARLNVTEYMMQSIFMVPDEQWPLHKKIEAFVSNMFSYAAQYPHRIMFFIRNVVFAFPNDTPGPGFLNPTRGCSHTTVARSDTLQQWFEQARKKGDISEDLNIEETVLSLIGVVNIRMHKLLVEPGYTLGKPEVSAITQRFLKAIDYRQDCGDTAK